MTTFRLRELRSGPEKFVPKKGEPDGGGEIILEMMRGGDPPGSRGGTVLRWLMGRECVLSTNGLRTKMAE